MNRRIIKNIALLLMIIAGSIAVNQQVHAETQIRKNIYVQVDGGQTVPVRGLWIGYDNNHYVSLLDIQKLFAGTDKAFDMGLASGKINIIMEKDIDTVDNEGEDCLSVHSADENERELSGWNQGLGESLTNASVGLNEMMFNGNERRYYTMVADFGGYYDCFVQVTDLCLIMNLCADTEDGVLVIDTTRNMPSVNPIELEEEGYFHGINSILVGDATTGEILYEYNGDMTFPIASTTKLMTYLLVEQAITQGKISLDDVVTISKTAEDMSKTSDGLIPMKEGQTATVRELINAALIISSNESDHALSEYIAGSEENVVNMMNNMAEQLDMTSAIFYNCNGLPIYTEGVLTAKRQNRMTSKDMFKLASYILNNYPEVKDVTSIKRIKMESFDKELKNTNPLLYNMEEVNGLKTGTTNRSGACLVTSLTVNDSNTNHDLVVVMFGAESSADRGRVSELLARYGKAVVLGEAEKSMVDSTNMVEEKLSAKNIVNLVVNKTMLNAAGN